MKKITFTTLLSLISVLIFAQERPSIVNRFKLLITNERKEYLLVKWQGNWEVPGSAYGDTISLKPINAFLNDMSAELGVSIGNRKLAGVFTYYMNDRTYPMIFSYYTAKLKSATTMAPAGIETKWFSFPDMLKTIPYPNSVAILRVIVPNPRQVWGGAFKVYPSQGWRYETIEDFYRIN